MRSVPSLVAATMLTLGMLASCGSDDEGAQDSSRPSVVVTTNILGDVVSEVLGDQADVEVIMPLGADPHDFAPSARQAEAMEAADLLVVNGAGFEEGMLGMIEAAEEAGTPVFAVADQVSRLAFDGEHEEHADEEHAEEEHAEEEGEHAEDPHVWTDPTRIATAVPALAERAGELDGVDAAAIAEQARSYVDELEALDAEIEAMLADIPPGRRVLVTNHEVFGYFADRYDFEVIGAVVPSLTTRAEASAADVEELAGVIRDNGVPAIFAETTRPAQLAETIADEVGGEVEVVELFTESLGDAGSGATTYVAMMRTDAERIAAALT